MPVDYLIFTTALSKRLFFLIFLICSFVLFVYYKEDFINEKSVVFISTEPVNYSESSYLVANPKCKIPNLEPFNAQAKKFYRPEKYTSCRKYDLLTYVTKTDNIAILHIDNKIIPSYGSQISCCYSNITRVAENNKPDDGVHISKCVSFENNVTLTEEIVGVKCRNAKKKEVYENTHVVIKMKKALESKLKIPENSTGPISVLFVGIDSISRLNFIRSLPKTREFVENNFWIPLYGYNKIEDNTFPNVMAILTGYNQTTAYSKCDPKTLDKLDNCSMLWYDFRNLGYITGYAEDDALINTFNYHKKGFTNKPTDFYLRPYMLASEKLKTTRKDGMTYCTGPETSGERIMNAAKDFATTFKQYANFGFFWMNTFSHNEINSATGMDGKIHDFLQDLKNSGVLNNSIVVFLSDHGIRFGEIRYSQTGWLEERLPFIYFSFPNWFKFKFKKEYRNFKRNTKRLTTPYDLHMTLEHILVLSGFNYTVKPSDACPKCKSLFEVIEYERSCEDAAIEQHWCTCSGYTSVDRKNETIRKVAKFIVSEIKTIIRKRDFRKCAKYSLNKIISASVSESFSYKNDTYLLIVFETKPKAVFESTVLVDGDNLSLVGGISRLDSYSTHSKCTEDAYLQKYCYCR